MRQSIKSAVEQITSNPNKENEAWAWFCVGAELQRIGRSIKSSKIIGQEVQKTPLVRLPASDRSDARWMFQNWNVVLEWIEHKTGDAPEDPFHQLARLNHSHPSAIRRQIRSWHAERDEAQTISAELAAATQAAFETVWKRSSSAIELSDPSINVAEGIEYLAKLEDPFVGTTRGRYPFSWSEIAEFLSDPGDVSWLHESVSEYIVEMSEADDGDEGWEDGDSELVVDDDGRVHFRRDLEV